MAALGVVGAALAAGEVCAQSNADRVAADFGGKMPVLAHYAVDPMSETKYLPDVYPEDGDAGAPVRIVAAKGEFEPGAFILHASRDLGKVTFEVCDLRTEDGKVFPKAKLDLKTVKIWYQAATAWYSYFADPAPRLCPELLLNDEDFVRVDEAKRCNYLCVRKDGKTEREFWLGAPKGLNNRVEGQEGFYNYEPDRLQCMRPEFRDAATHQGATLKAGSFKEFFLTADVGKDVAAGLYKGEVKVKSEGGQWSIPVLLRVLPFELPEPGCYFDPEKPYRTWFCDSSGFGSIMGVNGNDRELAKRQLLRIATVQREHGITIPSYSYSDADAIAVARAAGQHPEFSPWGTCLKSDLCKMRADAKMRRRQADKIFGKGSSPMMGWGDEYGLGTLRMVRPMIEIYQAEGFVFSINSRAGYAAGANVADIFWPPVNPDHRTSGETSKFNDLGGNGYFGWYACQHVAVENPAFNRRQNGFGPYRAGFSCNYNYEIGLTGWNDISSDIYRPMRMYYGTGDGCVCGLQYEGFREGLDDIRYATLLKKLALPLSGSKNVKARYAARLALKCLADADDDAMDLTALRLEMIEHILKLLTFKEEA